MESELAALPFGIPETCRILKNGPYQKNSPHMITPPQSSVEAASTLLDAAALVDAPFLFRNFHENVILSMMAMPLGKKSPWKILNMSSAIVTYGDLTMLGSQNISHARQANLCCLLACSALHLSLKPSIDPPGSVEYWKQAADQMFQQAKDHMQNSLKLETQEPKKAKYKRPTDGPLLLDRICCEFTIFSPKFMASGQHDADCWCQVLSGQQQHARGFMTSAELILRMRGLPKRKISQKSRLLHHAYTWLRLVGESTNVLHDYSPSPSFIEALIRISDVIVLTRWLFQMALGPMNGMCDSMTSYVWRHIMRTVI